MLRRPKLSHACSTTRAATASRAIGIHSAGPSAIVALARTKLAQPASWTGRHTRFSHFHSVLWRAGFGRGV